VKRDDYFISDGVVALAYVAVRLWLLAAHEARMEGRTVYYIHAVDRSPIPRQRSLL
jgi:hypothetical protein